MYVYYFKAARQCVNQGCIKFQFFFVFGKSTKLFWLYLKTSEENKKGQWLGKIKLNEIIYNPGVNINWVTNSISLLQTGLEELAWDQNKLIIVFQ